VQLETTPKDAVVALDGRPVGGMSPFVIRGITVGSAHTIAVQRSGYRPWASRFELQSEQQLHLPDVALDPLESGFALDSVPSGASVYVDGNRLAQTTPVRVAAISPGEHRIRLEAQGYLPWESSLKVTLGSVLDLPVAQLIARSAEPNYQAGVRVGASTTGDGTQRRSLPPRHMPASSAAQDGIDTEPRANVNADSKANGTGNATANESAPPAAVAMATLRVQTRPWSSVFVDGHLVGNTPLMNVPIKAGRRTLTFVNEEFRVRKTVTVQVEPGQVLTQVLNLTN
jgi:serine/threonine-protein kinase